MLELPFNFFLGAPHTHDAIGPLHLYEELDLDAERTPAGQMATMYLLFGDPVLSLWLLTFEAGVRTPRSPSVRNEDWNQRSPDSLPNPKPMDSSWGDQL